MTTTQHTPGPWRARQVHSQMDDPGTTVATVGPRHPDGRQWMIFSDASHGDPEADARLMAAAPKLLELLEKIEYVLDIDRGDWFCPSCGMSRTTFGHIVDLHGQALLVHEAEGCEMFAALRAARGD